MPSTEPRFFSRDLSWLEFNQRVLDEARVSDAPALERLKFLAITASNMDEFFMVRVGGLKMMRAGGMDAPDPAGLTPTEQLARIAERVHQMVEDQYDCYCMQIEPALREGGIVIHSWKTLTPEQKRVAKHHVSEEMLSVVTPMAVDAESGFPLLPGLGINLLARLEPDAGSTDFRYAILPLGQSVRRLFTLPSVSGFAAIPQEDLLAAHADRFFPGVRVIECVPFRLTRNAGLSVRDEYSANLLAEMESLLDARKQSDCVRLEVAHDISIESARFLQDALGVADIDLYRIRGPLSLAALMPLAGMDGFESLKNKPWTPQASSDLDLTASIFDQIARRDILLYHPFESFDPVVRLVEEAAADPNVLAIKQILYRTSRSSQIVAALREAAKRGKYVTAIVELKARFDEARNIEWARDLERAGVQVIYGVKGLKTHAKVCIIVRRESAGIVRYVHFGTGNYNEITARQYTDVSYLTSNRELASEASSFLNAITGYSQPQPHGRLAYAPVSIRRRLEELIQGEIERKRQGQDALIMAKVNSLVDQGIIEALYAASQAGVRVLLNVRGICCLRPGVPGMSDTITVTSIVDRFLEHSRIFYFLHGGDEDVFISSADWMSRNLDRRVELMVPVADKTSRARLIHILRSCFKDTVKGRLLQRDGTYAPARPARGQKPFQCQRALFEEACERVEALRQSQRTTFVPHQRPNEKA
jgi:polyphosphate kinase